MEFAATVVILTCTNALLAAGIVILYKAGRVVNFAHGELAIVGGYVFYSAGLMGGGDQPSLWLAILGALVFSVIMGVFIYMAMMRRLVGEPFYVAILITVGIGIVLKSAILVVWRAERLTIDIGVAPAIRLAGGATLSLHGYRQRRAHRGLLRRALSVLSLHAARRAVSRHRRKSAARQPARRQRQLRSVAGLGHRHRRCIALRYLLRRPRLSQRRERHASGLPA